MDSLDLSRALGCRSRFESGIERRGKPEPSGTTGCRSRQRSREAGVTSAAHDYSCLRHRLRRPQLPGPSRDHRHRHSAVERRRRPRRSRARRPRWRGSRRSWRPGGSRLTDVRQILLTHIHLDHAGLRRCADGGLPGGRAPRARARRPAHDRPVAADGQRDPALRRRHGAAVGGDAPGRRPPRAAAERRRARRRWPAGRSRSPTRPGHASHHVSYFDRSSGIAFVGDVAGIRRGQGNYVLPPTPPPDIDLEAWRAERATCILAWDPDTLFLTHFGPFQGVRPHFQELFERLQRWSEIVRRLLADPSLTDDERQERFVAEAVQELRRTVGESRSRSIQPGGPARLLLAGAGALLAEARPLSRAALVAGTSNPAASTIRFPKGTDDELEIDDAEKSQRRIRLAAGCALMTVSAAAGAQIMMRPADRPPARPRANAGTRTARRSPSPAASIIPPAPRSSSMPAKWSALAHTAASRSISLADPRSVRRGLRAGRARPDAAVRARAATDGTGLRPRQHRTAGAASRTVAGAAPAESAATPAPTDAPVGASRHRSGTHHGRSASARPAHDRAQADRPQRVLHRIPGAAAGSAAARPSSSTARH